ncbi:MAG: hypothetical protein R3C56_19435 [Pirellulaceae bacterium]
MRLAEGGMGVVYEAEQESLGRHVAIKVLPFHALMIPNISRVFTARRALLRQLHHSNIVPVFGVVSTKESTITPCSLFADWGLI